MNSPVASNFISESLGLGCPGFVLVLPCLERIRFETVRQTKMIDRFEKHWQKCRGNGRFNSFARSVVQIEFNRMNPFQGYRLINPEDLLWRPSNLMKIPNADYLERTGSENLAARLWRLPPRSASTLHKHIRQEEFYIVLQGTGRMRVGEETLTVATLGAVLVGPDQLRQVFNDTDQEALWLIMGAPEELELLQGAKSPPELLAKIYPKDPTELPRELEGANWPPK